MPHPHRSTPPPLPACGLALLLTLLPAAAGAEPLEVPDLPGATTLESTPPVLDTVVQVPSLPADVGGAGPQHDEEAEAAAEEVPVAATLPAAPLEPPPLKPVEIMLDWYPGPQHAALLLAQHKGLFQQQGLDVQLSTPADPALPTRLLAAGRVDFVVTRQPLLHLQVARGQPLVRVGTLVSLPLGGLLLRDESADTLAGKRIGYSTEESRELLLPTLLETHGVRFDEVELVDINFSATAQMAELALDGVVTSQRLTLPRQLADEGIGTRLTRFEAQGIPAYEGLILVANRDRLGVQRPLLQRLLAALEEATAWMMEEPDAAWSRLAEAEPALDTPANREAWMATLLRLSARPAALDLERYRRFDAFLHDRGIIETTAPLHHLAIDPGAR